MSLAKQDRAIDWSAVKGDALAAMRRAVLRFVRGYRGERKNEVTRKQILDWFKGTPSEFVEDAILDAVTRDELRPCRAALVQRSNSKTVYEITDKGREALKAVKPPPDFEDVSSHLEQYVFVHRVRANDNGTITAAVTVYWTDASGQQWEFHGDLGMEKVS